MKEFVDYPKERIEAKLKQVRHHELKYGKSERTKAWIKWCTSYEYRKAEWQWRQGFAAAIHARPYPFNPTTKSLTNFNDTLFI